MMVQNIEDLYELTPMQQGMLFQSLYAPQSGAYCVQLSCVLRGKLDVGAFMRAWRQVLERHTILRTSFFWEEIDKPLQVVHRSATLPLAEHDWRELTTSEQESRFQSLLEDDRRRGFELSTPPLLRLALIRAAEDSYNLLWSFHHLLLDGWSVSLLFKELFAFYDAATLGERVQLKESRPFREYVAWLQQQDLARAEEFWRESLKGFTAQTPLSLARSSVSNGEKNSYAEQKFTASEITTKSLQLFARQHQLTINTLVQGAWALLLSRYSGEQDVVFGVTTAGRPADLQGADNMIGLFINTLPARVEISQTKAALSWLKRLQQQQAEVRHYEHTPLAHVQRWSEIERGGSLFDSILVFENYPVEDIVRTRNAADELQVTDLRFHEQTEYPLTIVAAAGSELTFRIGYDPARFSKSFIERMAGHLHTILNSILLNPRQPVSHLSLLSHQEQHQLLHAWNDTRRDFPLLFVHQLFEQQVERTPAAPALIFEGQQLTYRELNNRANRLAHHLRELGVRPESLVGIMMERSLEMVISLLAVLKAGGAYLPLDPEYPQERLSFMLADAGVTVILTTEELQVRASEDGAQIVCLDKEEADLTSHSAENLRSEVRAENLAYVIYTSGSTGQPKAAMNTHGALANRLLWMQDAFHLTSHDTVLHKTPFSFDVSVWEFFWPLITGARLVIARPAGHRDSAYLRDVIKREAVTTLHFVPSMLRAFVEERGIEECESVRRVICSGEELPASLAERLLGRMQGAELHNLYGPTEAAIDVTWWACERGRERESVPIGRPIANTRIYILDEEMRVVPIGVEGEIYIGGAGVGRGYLGRAEQTAERYVPDEYGGEMGGRMYRTGDVGRWGEDGSMEYVGRVDYQVKVRGHRIELGEVESALRRCRGVRECVVVTQGERGADLRLVAYVVESKEEIKANVSEWREQLVKQLPEYMMPSVFVKLEQLPLTPGGKLDRRALPDAEVSRTMLGSSYAAPYTLFEELLVEIWAAALNVESLGTLDNFFELGGDSIRSIQIFAKARQAGINFTIQQLFKHPTIRELARVAADNEAVYIETAETGEFSLISESDRQRLPADVEDAYPLTQLQAGMIFHSEYRPTTAIYHDIFTFHLNALFDAEIIQTVLNQTLARHPVLRTSFDLSNFSEPLQLVHKSIAAPLKVDDLSRETTARQDELLAAWLETEKSRNFDWSHAPLVRFYIHTRSENSFQFTLSFHHAVLDGWSVASMLAEIFQHYASQLSAESTRAQLTTPAARFRDFVSLERAALESAESRSYWNEKLSGSAFVKIPRRHSASPTSDATQTRKHDVSISPEISARLHEIAREASVPLKSVLLAAHLRVMSLLSGQTDVTTGMVSNGRPELEDGERVLGLFLNALPLRLRLDGGTWVELLQATFEAERESLPFRRYPMAQMQREQGGRALFEAGFNFNHFHLFKSLPEFAGMEMVDSSFFEATNYALTANFARDVFSTQIQLNLTYNANDLSDEQIASYGNYYASTLGAIADDPSARYEHSNLLTQAEQQLLLHTWNDTRRDFPSLFVHQLFEQQVERTPAAPALIFEGQQLTYRELNMRANRLAHHLRELGVCPESLVGVMMERSPEMVVSLLAVLKAGGAYLPLDPEYPQERLSFMLADAGVTVILTTEELRARAAKDGTQVVCLDREEAGILAHSAENVRSEVQAENLAYVIYTSGSTGQPNGVLIQHRSLSNLIHQARSIFLVDARSRILHVASFSFDAATLELFLALTSGARLFLTTADERLSPHNLHELISREALTSAVLTPSLLKALDETKCQSLRVVSSGAERLTLELARRWTSGGRRLINCYGPTEATVFATYKVCAAAADEEEREREPGIGRGIENVRVYILDGWMGLVPVGVEGEIYIGGAGVGRGYLGRAEQTAERYVPDEYGGEMGGRVYRTGDIGRWREDGSIEYVGRRDEQVKVRGQRVELGEVEGAIGREEGVRECVVTGREGEGGEVQLVAYVVADKLSSQGKAAHAGVVERDETKDENHALRFERVELCPSVAEYFVYDDYLYDTLTHDEKRNDIYRAAINKSVKGKVALDIGTGADAILARLCVEAGAKRVYAVEILERTYRQAASKLKSLGLEEKIILINDDVTKVQLPEQVDVCVSEIVGSIGGSEGAAIIINDARRLLKDDGVMIPRRSTTRVAAASLPDELLENPGFSDISANYAARIFEQVGHPFDLRLCIRNFPPSHLISETGIFEDLNFTERIDTEYRREVRLRCTRKGRLEGFLVWLNLYPGEGAMIDILEPGYSWFPIYFPVFHPGVEVEEGDVIEAVCRGKLSANGINPDYGIAGKLKMKDGLEIEFEYQSAHDGGGYRQTPFYKLIFDEDGAVRRSEERELTSRSLRARLKKRLPDYMIPQTLLFLDELPLTPTGKIDRRALPAPGALKSEIERTYIAPRTPLEQSLAAIWTQLLGVEQIGIHDNFFDLGGHSLLSTRLISHVRQSFAVELQLRRFFEIPTVAMLAVEIERLVETNTTAAAAQEAGIKPLSRQSRLIKRSALEQRSSHAD